MTNRTLERVYAEHVGKVADRWSSYLTEYSRLFDDYRDKPIRLLEIGIQNGGSLEIWSKYFSNASAVIGCDINPDCARLSYDDPRIGVIIGDANAIEVCEQVFRRSPQFDIVIDDGSHLSSDIVKSFALYFPRVTEGGIYIAEDLHCSYWGKFEGGLFDPFSSISFFKGLADIINYEHWGIAKTRDDILRGIFSRYDCEIDIDIEALSQVHSVEFINSMCVVRKAPSAANSLGHHVIAGSVELVVQGHHELQGCSHELPPDLESNNPWNNRKTSYDEMIQETELRLAKALDQITSLGQTLAERDVQIASFGGIVDAYESSTSWRLTKPVRIVGQKIKRIKRMLVLSSVLFSNLNGLKKVAIKLRSEGLGNVEHYVRVLRSEEFAAKVSGERGLSPEFLDALVVLGSVFLRSVPRFMLRGRKQIMSYKAWTRIEQKRLEAELPDITRHIDVMLYKPIFTIVIDTRQSLDGWKESLKSIRKQIYPHCDLRVLVSVGVKLPNPLEKDAKPLLDVSFTDVLGEFIVFIECGQSLSSNALYEFANAINQYPDLDLVYGDEDRLRTFGKRCNPFYKPDWSPDYLETFNYIGFPACFRTTVARGCFDDANLYDLTLRFTERTTKIMHVAKTLGHRRERKVDDEALEKRAKQDTTALEGRLNRTRRQGTVREHKLHRGCYDIELQLRRKPLVSIVIPTAGRTVTVEDRQIDLITNVVGQIRNQSTYKNIEIIVVDNGDLSERQQQFLTDHDCRRLTYAESVLNIPKKLNLGASIARGELLLLMNDDIEILEPAWIERMVEHFEKPHVGVVGAKLLYPDGRTQHVGVVHNSGNPDHVRRLFPGDEAGYYFSTCGVRNFMAVTGAVMMTLSDVYRQVGGYSEELAVSFNDTDYCLKVGERGFRTVYAPKVELTHMESQSRVASADIREVAWYHKRWWASHIVSDPYYNEQFLTVARPTFVPWVNRRQV